MSSASSGEVDITGSPAVAVFAALHAALPLGHLQEVSCDCLLLQSFVGRLGCSQSAYLKAGLLACPDHVVLHIDGQGHTRSEVLHFTVFFHGYRHLL